MKTEVVEELVQQILKGMRETSAIPTDRRLWSIAQIADYCGKSEYTVQTRIVVLPDFPQRIQAYPGAKPRWIAGEVMNWFEDRRARA